MTKHLRLIIVLLIGVWSDIGLSEEAPSPSQRDQIFDDTPIHTKTLPAATATPGYKSFQNQGMGKVEMLENIDQHLATMTTMIGQLGERISKIEETIKIFPQEIEQIKNNELPAIKKQLSTSVYAAPVSAAGGSGNGATLGKVLDGIGDGELKEMKAKIEEMHVTSVPNLQFEVSLLKDTVRTLEAIISSMDTLKVKAQGGVSVEQDKKKAP